jgi:hypothetical protein
MRAIAALLCVVGLAAMAAAGDVEAPTEQMKNLDQRCTETGGACAQLAAYRSVVPDEVEGLESQRNTKANANKEPPPTVTRPPKQELTQNDMLVIGGLSMLLFVGIMGACILVVSVRA